MTRNRKKPAAEKSDKENSPQKKFAAMEEARKQQEHLKESATRAQQAARKSKAAREKTESIKVDRSRPGGEKRMERSLKVASKQLHQHASGAAKVATVALKLFEKQLSGKMGNVVQVKKSTRRR